MLSSLLKPGREAPPFHLLDDQGHALTRDGLLAQAPGGLVLLFFTCDYWKADLQLLQSFAEAQPRFAQQGIRLAGISAINWELLHHLRKRQDLPYPLLFDACCRVSRQYGAVLIPKFVTGRAVVPLDARGRVVFSGRKAEPDTLLQTLIRERAAQPAGTSS